MKSFITFSGDFRFDDDMHVVGSHMRSNEAPTAVRADCGECLKDDRTTLLAFHRIRGLLHVATLNSGSLWIGFYRSASELVVPAVDRAARKPTALNRRRGNRRR